MPKCNFNIKLESNFIEIALRHGCSQINLLHIFRTRFPKSTSGRLLLAVLIFNLLILISSRGRSRAPLGTKIDFFVTTSSDSPSLTVVTKNFILEPADVLDPPLLRLQDDRH